MIGGDLFILCCILAVFGVAFEYIREWWDVWSGARAERTRRYRRASQGRFLNTIVIAILAVIACLLWLSIAFQQGKVAAADLCLKDLAACAKIVGKPEKTLTFKTSVTKE
jgi:hypothetical protein